MNTRRAWWFGGVCVVGGVVLSGYYAVAVTHDTPSPVAGKPETTEPAREETAAPRSQRVKRPSEASAAWVTAARLNALEARLQELDEGEPAEPAIDPEGDPLPPPRPPPEEQVATIDHALAAEPRDGEWAAAMEETVEATLQDARLRGTVAQELECRSTFCRIVVEHDRRESERMFRVLPILLGSTVSAWTTDTPDGTLATTAYVLRNGHDDADHPVAVVAANGHLDTP